MRFHMPRTGIGAAFGTGVDPGVGPGIGTV
jgi:hypothetical protein